MKCYIHADKEPVGACVLCGQLVCEDCAVQIKGKLTCKECVKKLPLDGKRAHEGKASDQGTSLEGASNLTVRTLGVISFVLMFYLDIKSLLSVLDIFEGMAKNFEPILVVYLIRLIAFAALYTSASITCTYAKSNADVKKAFILSVIPMPIQVFISLITMLRIKAYYIPSFQARKIIISQYTNLYFVVAFIITCLMLTAFISSRRNGKLQD